MQNIFTKFLKKYGIVLFDGGLATQLELNGITLHPTLWSAYCLISNPKAIEKVHYDYYVAGADVGITASYQASRQSFKKIGLSDEEADKLIQKSVDICKQARDRFWNDYKTGKLDTKFERDYPLVAASCGCYGAILANGSEYTGDYGNEMSIDELASFHQMRLDAILKSVPDLIAFETIPTLKEVEAICKLLKNYDVQAYISCCCKNEESLSSNEKFEEAVKLCNSCDQIIGVGINCTNPKYLPNLINIAKKYTNKEIIVYPNSGEEYDTKTNSWIKPEGMIEDFGKVARLLHDCGARIIGGCCRVDKNAIQQMFKEMRKVH